MKTIDPRFRNSLQKAFEHSLNHLESLDTTSVAATLSYRELRGQLGRSLTREGVSAEQVIADLVADTKGGLLGNAGGRFFAWVIGGSVPSALAADWLTSAWDQNSALYA